MFSLISLCLVLGLLSACGSGKSSGADQTTAETTSQSTTESASTTTDSSTSLDLSDMQQIGEDGYGYVYVPSDWIKFHDIATGGASYQYADPSTYNVVTLYSYTAEDLGVTAIDSDAVEQVANSYAYNIEQQGTFENLTGAMAGTADSALGGRWWPTAVCSTVWPRWWTRATAPGSRPWSTWVCSTERRRARAVGFMAVGSGL